MTDNQLILYSFRRCPYAMRARLALHLAKISYKIREVSLKNKPSHLLKISPKGQVPVLFSGHIFLEESLDIVLFSLKNSSYFPEAKIEQEKLLEKVKENDTIFKKSLDICKYSIRYKEEEIKEAKKVAFSFLEKWNEKLSKESFLSGESFGFLDICLFPFLRQFSKIKPDLLGKVEVPHLKKWLKKIEESPLFEKVMEKHPLYEEETSPLKENNLKTV